MCDEKKITEANIQGAPDLIAEVLSQATAVKDRREKKAIYGKYGMREYIIIDPTEEYIERFWLEADGVYDKGNVLGAKEGFIFTFVGGGRYPSPGSVRGRGAK